MRLGSSRFFYGWIIVAISGLIAFSSGPGQSYGFSVFLDSIIEDTNLTRTRVSLLYAIGTGVSALMVAGVSRMADRFGPRIMAAAVATLMGFACFGMAGAVGGLQFFFAFAALRALGQGSLPINATLLTATWFVARRGRAMAIMGLGFAASNAVIPPVARLLIDSIGWREAYVVLGFMVWILVIPGVLLFVRNSPEEMGLHPDGAPHPPEGEAPVTPGQGVERDRRRVFSSSTFWLIALPLSTPSLVVTAIIFHQTSIFEERGLSADVAAFIFPVMAITSAVTALIAGPLVDRLGPIKLVRFNLLVLLVALFFIQIVSTPVMAALYGVLLGVSGGSWQIVNGVTWAHLYGRRGLGRIQGSAVMISITAAAIGPLPLSAIRDATGNYSVALLVMAGLVIAGAVTIGFAHPERQTTMS
ncbi:MAG: MFS transporter [Thermomicrobiales bacterium]